MIELKSKEKKNPEVCSIHKALLCFCSPYHDRLLNGNFSEALYPPTEPLSVQSNVGILQLFSKWLYTGSIHVTPPPSVESCVEKWFSGTTKLYVLADELNCVALQRAIISAQVKFSKNMALAGWEAIELLSDSSLESSGLYQYHVEAFAQHWNGKTEGVLPDPSSETDDPMPPNFAYRLLMKRMEVTSDRRCACCRDPCKFHGHTSEEERKATCESLDDIAEAPGTDCNYDTEPESDGESEYVPRDKSAVQKRSHEDGDAAGSKTKRVKTT